MGSRHPRSAADNEDAKVTLFPSFTFCHSTNEGKVAEANRAGYT